MHASPGLDAQEDGVRSRRRQLQLMEPQEQIDALFEQQGDHPEEYELLVGQLRREPVLISSPRPTSSKVYSVSFQSGQSGFFKPLNDVSLRIAQQYGHSQLSATLSECAAWRLARALGSPFDELVVPAVFRFLEIEDRGSLPGALTADRPGREASNAIFIASPEECAAGAFFDALLAQQDRTLGNVLWDQESERLFLIDHGFTFALPQDPYNEGRLQEWRWTYGSQALRDFEIEALTRLIADPELLGLRRFLDPDRASSLESRAHRMADASETLRVGDF